MIELALRCAAITFVRLQRVGYSQSDHGAREDAVRAPIVVGAKAAAVSVDLRRVNERFGGL